MIPPEAPANGQEDREAGRPPAVSVCLEVMKVRADFLRAAQARRQGTPGYLVQARERREGEGTPGTIRVGFTASKKIGNAVTRNRAKRRLREIARAVLPLHGRPGWDYVLVARPEATISRDFEAMKADLIRTLGQIHGTRENR